MRCPICEVGRLQSQRIKVKKETLLSFCSGETKEGDTLRRRRCDWCAAEVVTAERVAALLTPPKGEKIAELEKAKRSSSTPGMRNPWH
jgi:transcriptional regulator NrdR family protein